MLWLIAGFASLAGFLFGEFQYDKWLGSMQGCVSAAQLVAAAAAHLPPPPAAFVFAFSHSHPAWLFSCAGFDLGLIVSAGMCGMGVSLPPSLAHCVAARLLGPGIQDSSSWLLPRSGRRAAQHTGCVSHRRVDGRADCGGCQVWGLLRNLPGGSQGPAAGMPHVHVPFQGSACSRLLPAVSCSPSRPRCTGTWLGCIWCYKTFPRMPRCPLCRAARSCCTTGGGRPSPSTRPSSSRGRSSWQPQRA